MAATASVRFDVTIRVATHGAGDLPGFLDMLRYEGGRVTGWDRLDDTRYRVTIEVAPAYSHQPGRWASFGIVPVGTTASR